MSFCKTTSQKGKATGCCLFEFTADPDIESNSLIAPIIIFRSFAFYTKNSFI